MSSKHSSRRSSKKKRGKGFPILAIITIIIGVCCGIYIVKWNQETGVNAELMEDLHEEVKEVNEETGEAKIDFAKLKAKNKDTIGWLKIPSANVDYPIVKASDNDYYLKRNFNGESNVAGWLFADYRNKGNGSDDNFIIYGHNMKNGTMFGTLKKKILDKNWYNNEENLNMTYETESTIYTYKVFAVYEIPDEGYFVTTSFKSDADHMQFLNTIKSRSKKDFGISLNSSSKIMTLSTCSSTGNGRVVLHAVQTASTPNV